MGDNPLRPPTYIQVEVAEEHLQTFQNALNGLPKLAQEPVVLLLAQAELQPVLLLERLLVVQARLSGLELAELLYFELVLLEQTELVQELFALELQAVGRLLLE